VQNGRSLEDLVREMLRPMLKSWLDDNLPSMVERLVHAEIERVSRARG
jgi:cell pole-organizing protein PopZ